MFHFIDFHSTSATVAQDKGKLFERLVKSLVSACGYKDIELRAKISSMEYDITARTKLDNVPLVGEAKAHTKKIDGETIASFVGKMHPIWAKDPRTLGLFISTSDLTPDAKDWVKSVLDTKAILRIIIGQEILDMLGRELNYQTANQIKTKAEKEFDARTGDTLFLVSDRGDFFIQLLIRKHETRPKAFCIYHADGSTIDELAFGRELKELIPELEELLLWPSEMKVKTFPSLDQSRMAPLQGHGWFDYRFPAPPDCFIGRAEQKRNFESFVVRFRTKKSKVSVFQVLSRSGVGKSSFLLKLQNDLGKDGVISVIADARDFRSTLDLLDVVQQFVQALNTAHNVRMPIPDTLASGLLSLQAASQTLEETNDIGVVFIDQFESLFAKPELYAAFYDLLLGINHLCDNILFCIARKNDQPTTFDDRSKIDLEHLREISETVVLEDFPRDEALSLIGHAEDEIGQPLLDQLREMALEFSQGFPWLHKRICAHIITMIEKGSSQEELVQAGLKPEELFREELADLDEAERDFLKRLAQYLPATLAELSEVFRDGDVLIRRIDSLQAHRLIRLSGRTYDTYNDVLKEHLKTGRIPFGVKYVFRASPGATLNLLHRILTHNWKTVADIRDKERKSPGGIFNRLRELRLLGLLDYSQGRIRLAEVTTKTHQDGTLGDLIQNRVKQNGLVKDTLDRLAATDRISFAELKSLMRTSMPLLEVSEDTWDAYAKYLSSWLDKTKLASRSGKDVIVRKDKGIITPEELTRASKQGVILPADFFIPSAYVSELTRVLEFTREASARGQKLRDITNLARIQEGLCDCCAVGLVARASDGDYSLTPRGKRFVANFAEAKEILKEFLLSKANVVRYLEKVGGNPTSHIGVLKETLVDTDPGWTAGTWGWRSKVLANWLVFAELVSRRKGRVTSYPARLF